MKFVFYLLNLWTCGTQCRPANLTDISYPICLSTHTAVIISAHTTIHGQSHMHIPDPAKCNIATQKLKTLIKLAPLAIAVISSYLVFFDLTTRLLENMSAYVKITRDVDQYSQGLEYE